MIINVLLALCLFFFLTGRWTAPYLVCLLLATIGAGIALRSGALSNSFLLVAVGLVACLPFSLLIAGLRRWILPLITGIGPVLVIVLFLLAGVGNFHPTFMLVALGLGIILAYIFPNAAAALFSVTVSGFVVLFLTRKADLLTAGDMNWVVPVLAGGMLFQLLFLPRVEYHRYANVDPEPTMLYRLLDPNRAFPNVRRRLWALPAVLAVVGLAFHIMFVVLTPAIPVPDRDPYLRRMKSLPPAGLAIGQNNAFYLTGRKAPLLFISGSGKVPRAQFLFTGFPVLDARLDSMRTVKDETELAQIGRACRITTDALRAALPLIRPGTGEKALRDRIIGAMRGSGADPDPAFALIVATGRNALDIHYNLCRDNLRDGELVVFDIGARSGGYSADLTRTLPAGASFTPDQRFYYNAVLDAQKLALAAVKEGISLRRLDRVARDCLKKLKLDQYFTHFLSHHVGLDVHDGGMDRDAPLKSGMVITVEPGIYIPDKGVGIRIEDTVVVEKNGCRILTAGFPKETAEIEDLKAQAGPR